MKVVKNMFENIKIKVAISTLFLSILFLSIVIVNDKFSAAQQTLNENKTIENSIPSIVRIESNKGFGTGFFVKNNYILTNYHVTSGDKEVNIIFSNGSTTIGTVTAYDIKKDIALIRIDKIFKSVPLSLSKNITLGQAILTIGHPLGINYTVSKGIVSNKNINIEIRENKINVFQIDAIVDYGNSGGPIMDLNGQVIGMTTAKSSSQDVEHIAFGISSSTILLFINKNIQK